VLPIIVGKGLGVVDLLLVIVVGVVERVSSLGTSTLFSLSGSDGLLASGSTDKGSREGTFSTEISSVDALCEYFHPLASGSTNKGSREGTFSTEISPVDAFVNIFIAVFS